MPVLMWFAPAGSHAADQAGSDPELAADAIGAAISAEAAFKLFTRWVPKQRFPFITASYATGADSPRRDLAVPPGDFAETLYIPYAGRAGFQSSLVLRGPKTPRRLDAAQHGILLRLGKALQERLCELSMMTAS